MDVTVIRKLRHLKHIFDHQARTRSQFRLGIGVSDGEIWANLCFNTTIDSAQSMEIDKAILWDHIETFVESMSPEWPTRHLANAGRKLRPIPKSVNKSPDLCYSQDAWAEEDPLPVAYLVVPKDPTVLKEPLGGVGFHTKSAAENVTFTLLSYDQARQLDPNVDSWMLLAENAALGPHTLICENGPVLPKELCRTTIEEPKISGREGGQVLAAEVPSCPAGIVSKDARAAPA